MYSHSNSSPSPFGDAVLLVPQNTSFTKAHNEVATRAWGLFVVLARKDEVEHSPALTRPLGDELITVADQREQEG